MSNNPKRGVRGDVKQFMDATRAAVEKQNEQLANMSGAFNQIADMCVALHQKQDAFRNLVRARLAALHDVLQGDANMLTLRSRLREITLLITQEDIRDAERAVVEEIRALAAAAAPPPSAAEPPAAPPAPEDPALDAAIMADAEKRWREEQAKAQPQPAPPT